MIPYLTYLKKKNQSNLAQGQERKECKYMCGFAEECSSYEQNLTSAVIRPSKTNVLHSR